MVGGILGYRPIRKTKADPVAFIKHHDQAETTTTPSPSIDRSVIHSPRAQRSLGHRHRHTDALRVGGTSERKR
jgi:hypothetical protein